MYSPLPSPRVVIAGDRLSPGAVRRSLVLASSDKLYAGKQCRHRVIIRADDLGTEFPRLVEHFIDVKHVTDFAALYQHVRHTLKVTRFGIGLALRRVSVSCYATRADQSKARVHITVEIESNVKTLYTANDVFLHYMYGLLFAGFVLSRRTLTTCSRHCLVRRLVSVEMEYTPLMQAMLLDIVSSATVDENNTPRLPPRRISIANGNERRYRRHSAELDKAALFFYPDATRSPN